MLSLPRAQVQSLVGELRFLQAVWHGWENTHTHTERKHVESQYKQAWNLDELRVKTPCPGPSLFLSLSLFKKEFFSF